MVNTAAIKQYIADAKADMHTFANATFQPVSQRGMAGAVGAVSLSAALMNMSVVFAANTPLFSRLSQAFQTLLNDAQDMMLTVATFAVVICILGILIGSLFGPKATSTMVSALKAVIIAFIFFQLMPVVLDTIAQVFGTGGTGTSGTTP